MVAIDLEKGGKGSFTEIVSVVRTFARFRPFTIQLEGDGRRSFNSLLFANIAEMAKCATLSETGRPDDGRFEVITLPHTAKWRILGVAIRAATETWTASFCGRGAGRQTAPHHRRGSSPIKISQTVSSHDLDQRLRSLPTRPGKAPDEHRHTDLISVSEASSGGLSSIVNEAVKGHHEVILRSNKPIAAIVDIATMA